MTIKLMRWMLATAVVTSFGLTGPLLAQTTDTTEPATTEPTTGDAPPALPPPLPPEPVAATPPPLPPQPEFYIDENGAPGGPYKLADLQALVAAGTLKPGTLAWTDGMAEWAAASGVAGLDTLFVATATPVIDDAVAPATDLATFVVGDWTQTGPIDIAGVGPGNANLTANFAADGTFSMGGMIEATNAETGTMTIQVDGRGNYTVQDAGGDQFSITQTGSAKMTIPGFAPVEQALAETTVYRMIDANTVEDVVTGDRLVRQP
jgi:hypothetical protein